MAVERAPHGRLDGYGIDFFGTGYDVAGRVALIGNAWGRHDHGVSAQGVSMAMAGAYVLAEALHTEDDHARAFRRYQERMNGEVTRRQCNALLFARSLLPGTRAGPIAQSLVSRLIMRNAFAPLLRRQFRVGTIPPPQNAATLIDVGKERTVEIVKKVTPPTGLRRRLWRLPLWLYRMGLGPLMGRRIMLLTHIGRVSGKQRQAVIEVIEHDEHGYVAASGFGPRADWYQNVLKTPAVTIQVGGRIVPATAAPLPADEGAKIMAGYAPRHPAVARQLCKIMGFAVDGSTDDYREVGRRIPFVRFTPHACSAAGA